MGVVEVVLVISLCSALPTASPAAAAGAAVAAEASKEKLLPSLDDTCTGLGAEPEII